jgi:hypothetical protein
VRYLMVLFLLLAAGCQSGYPYAGVECPPVGGCLLIYPDRVYMRVEQ